MAASSIGQLGCLTAGIVSTLLVSAAKSLALLLRPIRRRERGFVVYEGRVWHERRHPVVHKFEYNVRYALIPLDQACYSHHLTADGARKIAGTSGSVSLLTIPSSVGYEQNPLSVYYCYDKCQDGSEELVKCIAEVTNTPWAERVTFVFEPGRDTVAKPLHVSPFMDMLGTWKIEASQPLEQLEIVIQVHHPDHGNYFCAKLRLRESASSDPETFFWLMPHKVALWIYWQSLLLMSKGVPFLSHPKYSHGTAYRKSARQRDAQIGANDRYFSWREAASWPWT